MISVHVKIVSKLSLFQKLLIVVIIPFAGCLLYTGGALLNTVAVYANHGQMPALMMNEAMRLNMSLDQDHSILTWKSHLIPLCDIIPMPTFFDGEGWDIFSIGDMIIFTGQILYALTLPTILLFVYGGIKDWWGNSFGPYSAVYLPNRAPGMKDPSRDGFATRELAEEYIFSRMCEECREERKAFLDGTEYLNDEERQPEEYPGCFFEWLVGETKEMEKAETFDDFFKAGGYETIYTKDENGK